MEELKPGQKWVNKTWQGDWKSTEIFLQGKPYDILEASYPSQYVVEFEILKQSDYDKSKWVVNRKMADGKIFNNVPVEKKEIIKKADLVEPPQPERSRLSRILED